jgi:hypothetical protein
MGLAPETVVNELGNLRYWVSTSPNVTVHPKDVVPNSGSVIGTILNAQGYATQYVTSSVIKP